jgi:hypothetical protein
MSPALATQSEEKRRQGLLFKLPPSREGTMVQVLGVLANPTWIARWFGGPTKRWTDDPMSGCGDHEANARELEQPRGAHGKIIAFFLLLNGRLPQLCKQGIDGFSRDASRQSAS